MDLGLASPWKAEEACSFVGEVRAVVEIETKGKVQVVGPEVVELSVLSGALEGLVWKEP